MRHQIAAAILGAGLLAGLSAPARAFDDRPSTLEPLWNILGTGSEDDKPAIDFRERPKLVVPKGTAALPPPVAGNGRSGNWPVDQDVARRKAAREAARAPRQIEWNKNPVLSPTELEKGRTDAPGSQAEVCENKVNGVYDCSLPTPAEKIKRVFGGGQDKETVFAGVEPPRTYLTEPPKGYRAAQSTTKATFDGPRRNDKAETEREYLANQAKTRIRDDE
jgi:hypothetical protein